jgi:hypothetical protein
MLNRTLQLLLAGCLMTGTLWAADNPFVRKWKVNPSNSKLNDEMKVEVNEKPSRSPKVSMSYRCAAKPKPLRPCSFVLTRR